MILVFLLIVFFSTTVVANEYDYLQTNSSWDTHLEVEFKRLMDANAIHVWGKENFSFHNEENDLILRVTYPKDSIDPSSYYAGTNPSGGGGFKFLSKNMNKECALLSYQLRFDKDFEWVLGGKLPGLFGGQGNSGGHIPTGFDGFSTRYMWTKGGRGKLYAYLPTSIKWGTGFGRDNIKFYRGVWHTLTQQIVLNTVGHHDGIIRVWLDSTLVVENKHILFRKTEDLKINGIMFSTFFGGNSQRWASKLNTFIDFKNFKLNYVK